MSFTPFTCLDIDSGAHKRIYAKHEYLGPTGSMKDRMVERALQCALESGDLKPGMEIAEASSGNTGAALARAGTSLGFRVNIFVSTKVSVEKLDMIRELGGVVHAIEVTEDYSEIDKAADFATEKGAYLFNQFGNPFHIPAYKDTIGAELLQQCAEQSLKIDHLVAGVGSGGSIRAIGEVLREKQNENLKVWAIVPAIYPSDIEGLNPGHLRREGHFQLWLDRQPSFEDGVIESLDEDAYRQVVWLDSSRGISVGPASGACLHVANNLPDYGNVLVLFSDAGWKYTQKIDYWKKRLFQ